MVDVYSYIFSVLLLCSTNNIPCVGIPTDTGIVISTCNNNRLPDITTWYSHDGYKIVITASKCYLI